MVVFIGTRKKMLLVLSLVLVLKQQFNKLINGKVKQIDIKNRTYYFHNDMVNLINFDSNLLKIYKKHYKVINIYYIGYITTTKNYDCENIHCVNPLYLIVNHASGCINKKNGNKYLIFNDSVNENKALLKKYVDVWDGTGW